MLRTFRDSTGTGALIFGMGNIGKSSLAARIANRMPRHRTVVVYERYDGPAIFEQLLTALPPTARPGWERTWREQIAADGGVVGLALEELLEGPFDERPILLVIDDLEQILEPPTPGQLRTPVSDAPGTVDAWRSALAGVLRAFGAASTDSRLLLTSRYDFTLADGRGHELADDLERVQLREMDDDERARQWQAARVAAGQSDRGADGDEPLVARVRAEAAGNPGLQEILSRPILSGELDAARAAADAVARWRVSGEVPADDNAAQEFFRRVSFEVYRDALTAQELAQLRAGTIFRETLPVPLAALVAAGAALDVVDPPACLDRLTALGLVDDWGADAPGAVPHRAVNALVRPLAGDPPSDAETERAASAAIAAIAAAWQGADGDFPVDARGVEAARLALAGNAPADMLDRAVYAAGSYSFYVRHDARSALATTRSALARIEEQGCSPRPQLLRLAASRAELLGGTKLRVALLENGLSLSSGDPVEWARIVADHAEATVADDPEQAVSTLRHAAAVLKQAGEERDRAVTMGKIADVLAQQGDVDEALRIHLHERLPVAQRMGDIESVAHIRLSCAQLRIAQGGLEGDAARIILDDLAESFALLTRLGRLDGVAAVGGLLGQLLARTGSPREARAALIAAADASARLGQDEEAARMQSLADEISGEG